MMAPTMAIKMATYAAERAKCIGTKQFYAKPEAHESLAGGARFTLHSGIPVGVPVVALQHGSQQACPACAHAVMGLTGSRPWLPPLLPYPQSDAGAGALCTYKLRVPPFCASC